MTIQYREQAFTIENVVEFQGHAVEHGEVSMSDSAFVEVLNEIYGDVSVCGYTYGSGDILIDQSPTTFNCMKGDHEDYILSELEDQLSREDDSNIEFEIDPDDLPSEDDVEDE